jgi:DNA-directed RNA polymerase subunit RPC12/RpoP
MKCTDCGGTCERMFDEIYGGHYWQCVECDSTYIYRGV